MAYGITGRADCSNGSADGDGITQVNSHATPGEKLTTASSGINIKSALASGAQVVADVRGRLHLESLQDTANQSISVSATVGVGAAVSGGVGQGELHNDYASVRTRANLAPAGA